MFIQPSYEAPCLGVPLFLKIPVACLELKPTMDTHPMAGSLYPVLHSWELDLVSYIINCWLGY